MAMFLGVHDMGGGASDEDIRSNWETYKAACAKLGGSPQHVHYSKDKGRAYCLTEANTADIVQKAHDEASVPLIELLEVQTAE